jgi:hypothetical protein
VKLWKLHTPLIVPCVGFFELRQGLLVDFCATRSCNPPYRLSAILRRKNYSRLKVAVVNISLTLYSLAALVMVHMS